MADRQRFCVIILSMLILGSLCYLGYFIFVNDDRVHIEMFNWMRLCIFFVQHVITLGMLMRLLYHEQGDDVIKWMFQLSLIIILTFIGGEVFTVIRGGRIFGSTLFVYQQPSDYEKQDAILEFQVNEITLYYQIMTDFVMFFIVSTIAIIVIKCKNMEEEQRYEFMIDNLKSEDFVDEPNVQDKKTCAICLTDLENQRVLKLPCDHIFHKECLVNWLKRSTICPLCRTDIEQSLDPNSPLRSPINVSPIRYPPQPQRVPELTFPLSTIDVQSNRLNSTDRVRRNDENFTQRIVQERNNIESRVSYHQSIRSRNQLTPRRENNQMNPAPTTNNNQINQSLVQSNNDPFPPRNHQLNSTRRLNIDVRGRRMDQQQSVEAYSQRSIYLPPPEAQRAINFKFNSKPNLQSQPSIKVPIQGEENKAAQIISSYQDIPFQENNFYPNPNERFVQTQNFRNTRETNDKRINEMVRDQIQV